MFKDLTETEKIEFEKWVSVFNQSHWIAYTPKRFYNSIVKCVDSNLIPANNKTKIQTIYFDGNNPPIVDRLVELAEHDCMAKELKKKTKKMEFDIDNLDREKISYREAMNRIQAHIKAISGIDVFPEMHKTKVTLCKLAEDGRYYPRIQYGTFKLTQIPGAGIKVWGRGRLSMDMYFADEIAKVTVDPDILKSK